MLKEAFLLWSCPLYMCIFIELILLCLEIISGSIPQLFITYCPLFLLINFLGTARSTAKVAALVI